MIGIYKITSPKDRIYIGQSININKRLLSYSSMNCKKQPRLYRSLLKYGYSSHKIEILEICLEEELNYKERFYQDLYESVSEKGLNCRLTESSEKTGELSKETKLKIGNANRGRVMSKEVREKMSLSKRGTKKTEEEKLKISKFHKDRKRSNETKLKMKENCKKAILVLNIETGIFYNSITEAAFVHNINRSTLTEMLKGTFKNKSSMIIV